MESCEQNVTSEVTQPRKGTAGKEKVLPSGSVKGAIDRVGFIISLLSRRGVSRLVGKDGEGGNVCKKR